MAVQMPNNFHSGAHQAMKKLAGDPRWAAVLSNVSEKYGVQPVDFYYNALRKLAGHLDIWETEYLQIMDGPRAVHEWIRSTGMRAYLERLSNDEQRATFEQLCLEEIEKAYRPNDQGKYCFLSNGYLSSHTVKTINHKGHEGTQRFVHWASTTEDTEEH